MADKVMALPAAGVTRLAPLLERRGSSRRFGAGIQLGAVSGLLWAGYGRRRDGGGVVPSAHELYLLALTVIAGHVDGLDAGAFSYQPHRHQLSAGVPGDHRAAIAATTLADQDWVATAAALLVITAEIEVLNSHFAEQPPLGRRGERYAWLEAGHLSQNVYLAAADLGLSAVLVAGVDDDALTECVTYLQPSLAPGSRALGILAVGDQPQA